jgi:hypothetical protein
MADEYDFYPTLDSLIWPVPDEVQHAHDEWRGEAAAVQETYRQWCAAPVAERARRHGAYRAALDREQAAAVTFAIACATCPPRALGAWPTLFH